MKMKRIKITVILIVALFVLSGCASLERAFKDTSSSFTGLNREVFVYSQDGKEVLRNYHGRIDIQENEYGNKVKFELNGKRVIIYNANVIVEEK